MKNFFKNLLHGKYPGRRRSSRNMKCVYAGPEDLRMKRSRMEGVYAGPQEMQEGMILVYAGPRNPQTVDESMECVYAGPQEMQEGMILVYAGPPAAGGRSPKPTEESAADGPDAPIVNV